MRHRAADFDLFAEQLRAGQRAVDDVEVDGRGKDQDENRGEEKVGDERPARGGLAHHVFDVRHQDFHSSAPSDA